MALTGLEKDINLPAPPQRARGLFLDAANPIPSDELVAAGTSRMRLGVTWVPWGTINLATDASDCDVNYNHTPFEPVVREVPAILDQPAFAMWDALKCSTLSSETGWLSARVQRNLTVYASAAMASELATAAASGGLPISGANPYPGVGGEDYTPTIINATAQSIRISMYELETHLASVLHGGEGMIHVSSGLLSLLAADELVAWDGRVYRTHTGHVVVGDPGWTGQYTPLGSSAASTNEEWMYATAPVWYALTAIENPDVLTDDPHHTDLLKNLNQPVARRWGLVTWDPSATGAIKVTIA